MSVSSSDSHSRLSGALPLGSSYQLTFRGSHEGGVDNVDEFTTLDQLGRALKIEANSSANERGILSNIDHELAKGQSSTRWKVFLIIEGREEVEVFILKELQTTAIRLLRKKRRENAIQSGKPIAADADTMTIEELAEYRELTLEWLRKESLEECIRMKLIARGEEDRVKIPGLDED